MSDVRPTPDAFDDEGPTLVTADPSAVPSLADALDFVLGRAPDRGTPADDARTTVLEVHQTWGGTLLDTVHARRDRLTAGEATGHRWQLLGTEIAWVPRPLALVLPFAPPMLSEVDTRPLADLALSGPGIPEQGTVPVFVRGASGWEARIQPGWEAVVDVDGELTELSALRDQVRAVPAEGGAVAVAVPEGGQLTVGIGEVQLHARLVPGARKAAAGSWLDRLDLFFLGLVGLMGVLGACFGVLIAALPASPASSSIDLRRFAEVVQPTMLEEPPEANAPADSGASEAAAKRKEGRKGQEQASPEPGGGEAPRPSDQVVAESSGALGALHEAGMNSGMGGPLEGGLLDGVGFLTGKGVALGEGGLGLRGDKLGGGGTVDGIGGIGVYCSPGTLCKGGPGGHGPGGWTKRTADIQSPSREVITLGNLDRAAVEKVIKANLTKFRYCYQRQLQRDPGLSGKIVNRFVIAQDGTVSRSETKASTVSPAVDTCIEQTMARLQFPQPKGGGIAIISYPFVFSAR